jgi:hypothetical protein
MSLVSEAGSKRSSAFWAVSTCPLVRSPTIHALAPIGGGGRAAAKAALETMSSRQATQRNIRRI